MMNDDQLLRYHRQIMLPEFDIDGQELLLAARVLIIGAGGLGCPVALYLAAAGVGTLVISDHDQVDLSNLQRQIAHSTRDIGRDKVVSLNETIHALNPDTHVVAITHKLEGDSLQQQIEQATVVVDCTDNFPTRFLLNSLCVKTRTPLVSGAATGFNGQVAVFDSRKPGAPCYNCLYSDVDEQQLSCSEAGILAPVTGVIGSLQATETIKVITNTGTPLNSRLLVFDAMTMEFHTMGLASDPECKTCSA